MMGRVYWRKVAYIKVARKEEKGDVPKAGTIFFLCDL